MCWKPSILLLLLSYVVLSCEVERFEPDLAEESVVEASTTSVATEQLLQLVNELRQNGCRCGTADMPPVTPLNWQADLAEAALRHAVDMRNNDFFDHQGSDGTDVARRLTETGYAWLNVGENIAWGYRDIYSVFLGWKDSPGHCRNMMNAAFRDMGAGRAGNYWVQTLARPKGN